MVASGPHRGLSPAWSNRSKRSMNGPSVISVGRISPDLARRSWARVHRIAVDGLGADPEDLRCLIAVFGHGDGVAGSIARVDRLLVTGTPARLRGRVAVQAALSSDPAEDTPGTLYLNWLFKPEADGKLVEDIYTYTLPVALCAALTGAPKARVTWDRADEIAARVMTAVALPQGHVS